MWARLRRISAVCVLLLLAPLTTATSWAAPAEVARQVVYNGPRVSYCLTDLDLVPKLMPACLPKDSLGQKWQYVNLMLRNLETNRCLDRAVEHPYPGALALEPCTNDLRNQWDWTADHRLVSRFDGQCLTANLQTNNTVSILPCGFAPYQNEWSYRIFN
jgi:hypothetical protein